MIEEAVTVYSISVKDHHNFFVSKEDILVHNMAVFVMAPPVAAGVFIAAATAAAAITVFGGCVYSFFCDSAHQEKRSNKNNSGDNNGDGRCWCGCYCGSQCSCLCMCGCSQRSKKQQGYPENNNGYTYKN